MSLSRKQKMLLCDNSYLRFFNMLPCKRARKRTSQIMLYRKKYGEFHHLYYQLRASPRLFHGYFRMSPTTFDYIVEAITPELQYVHTNFQKPISVEERLMVTLRYLATGLQFRQLAYSFRISKSAVAVIVVEVCKAIWKTLVTKHMPEPTLESFTNTANDFWDRWQFPNCLGCIDGKHIRIKRPEKSGSMYYCYKNYFSIGLLAVTDANYKFVMVDVGSYGKDNDAGAFENCFLRRAIKNGSIVLPNDANLPGTSIKAPFVFLGDEAFPLIEYLMRPFPRGTVHQGDEHDNFNYRLCRARMVVECSFGIIVSKFRLLGKSIETTVNNATHIVKAITLLHNIIIDLEGSADTTININSTGDTRHITTIRPSKRHNASSKRAISIRNTFSRYFKQRPLQRI